MQKIIYKVFFDYQKEEVWINEMASKGLSLIAYSPFRYVFEKTEKAQYTFKIELLDHMPSHPESENYIEFLEENKVKFVASTLRWIYLRKDNDGTSFMLETNVDTKVQHYKRYLLMVFPFWLINLVACFINLWVYLSISTSVNLFAFGLNFTVALLLGYLLIKYYRMYIKFKKEALIYE